MGTKRDAAQTEKATETKAADAPVTNTDAPVEAPTDAFEPGFDIEGNFDTDEEYKEMPLIIGGNYHGNVTEVKLDTENQVIIWVVTLVDNGGYMSDGATPVDGVTQQYKNWLPRSGDENELTTSGKQTKRQAKINMLADFAKGMKINMQTPVAIATALRNAEWLGLAVNVTIGVRMFQGRKFNDISRMVAA